MASKDWDDGFGEELACWRKKGIRYFSKGRDGLPLGDENRKRSL